MKRGFIAGSLVTLLIALGLAASTPATAEDIHSASPSSATADSVENAVTQSPSPAFYMNQHYGCCSPPSREGLGRRNPPPMADVR